MSFDFGCEFIYNQSGYRWSLNYNISYKILNLQSSEFLFVLCCIQHAEIRAFAKTIRQNMPYVKM